MCPDARNSSARRQCRTLGTAMAAAQTPDYGGMTVNERLFEAGLMSEFDSAVRARDREHIIAVLMRVALSKDDAAFTADTILANPKRYGF